MAKIGVSLVSLPSKPSLALAMHIGKHSLSEEAGGIKVLFVKKSLWVNWTCCVLLTHYICRRLSSLFPVLRLACSLMRTTGKPIYATARPWKFCLYRLCPLCDKQVIEQTPTLLHATSCPSRAMLTSKTYQVITPDHLQSRRTTPPSSQML